MKRGCIRLREHGEADSEAALCTGHCVFSCMGHRVGRDAERVGVCFKRLLKAVGEEPAIPKMTTLGCELLCLAEGTLSDSSEGSMPEVLRVDIAPSIVRENQRILAEEIGSARCQFLEESA